MDVSAATPEDLDAAPAAEGDSPPAEQPEALARRIARAGSLEDAFVLARAVYPLGAHYPDPVRRALVERTAMDHRLQRYLLLVVGGRRDALHDLLVWWLERGVDGYDPALARLSTYLYRVTLNRLVNERRRSERRGPSEGTLDDERIAALGDRLCGVGDVDALVQVRATLAEVPEREATAWYLAKIGGHSNAEIAAVTGLPLGAISRVVKRVNVRLTRRFGSADAAWAALLAAALVDGSIPAIRARTWIQRARAQAAAHLRSTAGRVVTYALAAAAGGGAVWATSPRPVAEPAGVRIVTAATAPATLTTATASQTPAPPRGVAPTATETRVPVATVGGEPTAPRAAASAQRRQSGDASAEADELDRAASQLRVRPATAARILTLHRRRWPRSAMSLTRDALEAEALSQTGAEGRARELAQRVVQQDPQSPEAHRMRVLGLVGTSP